MSLVDYYIQFYSSLTGIKCLYVILGIAIGWILNRLYEHVIISSFVKEVKEK